MDDCPKMAAHDSFWLDGGIFFRVLLWLYYCPLWSLQLFSGWPSSSPWHFFGMISDLILLKPFVFVASMNHPPCHQLILCTEDSLLSINILRASLLPWLLLHSASSCSSLSQLRVSKCELPSLHASVQSSLTASSWGAACVTGGECRSNGAFCRGSLILKLLAYIYYHSLLVRDQLCSFEGDWCKNAKSSGE